MSQRLISQSVDALGLLSAQIADLQKQAEDHKVYLREQGCGAYEGDYYRVTVSAQVRNNLDLAAVREKLSDQFIRAHTSQVESIVVRCVARSAAVLRKAA